MQKINILHIEEEKMQVETNCKFYKATKIPYCNALRELYCKKEKCGFFQKIDKNNCINDVC